MLQLLFQCSVCTPTLCVLLLLFMSCCQNFPNVSRRDDFFVVKLFAASMILIKSVSSLCTCKAINPPNLFSPMVDLRYGFTLFRVEKILSFSGFVAGAKRISFNSLTTSQIIHLCAIHRSLIFRSMNGIFKLSSTFNKLGSNFNCTSNRDIDIIFIQCFK